MPQALLEGEAGSPVDGQRDETRSAIRVSLNASQLLSHQNFGFVPSQTQ
jgi:hypothetical protein